MKFFRLFAAGWLLLLPGCISSQPWREPIAPPVALYYQNPLPVPAGDPGVVWETVADVVNDYFRIERENPMRVAGTEMTEGRLETFPEVGATVLEPWRHDSADTYERLESTLQSIRRRAEVRVSPSPAGYLVEVAVFKELEDVAQPGLASAGAATFRNDSSLTRVTNPIQDLDVNQGWIPLGRDRALEQRILAQLQSRLGALPSASPASAVPGTVCPPCAPVPGTL